jgi:hypothetical protein
VRTHKDLLLECTYVGLGTQSFASFRKFSSFERFEKPWMEIDCGAGA